MNLTLPELLLTAFLIGLALWRSKAALFLLWPISILVFPTARLMIGFPLYIYDVIAVVIFVAYHKQILTIRWSIVAIPWHYVFLGLVVVCGLIWPTLIYPLSPEMMWVSVHALIALLSFAFGALLFYHNQLGRERTYLGFGVAASLIVLGLIGLIQFGSTETSRMIAGIFYRDFGEDSFVATEFYVKIAAMRAAGPFGSANGLGIVGVLAALVVLILVRNRTLLIACLVAAAIAVLASVSRQAMIAGALALIAYFAFAQIRQKGGLTVVLIVLGPLLLMAFLGSDFAASTLERFSRWETGIQNDGNFTARYVDGPIRLYNVVLAFPDMVLFGTGPDINKLYGTGADVIGRAQGFLSIGYALYFFQYGILGFISALWMHAQAWAQLKFMPKEMRGKFAALLTAIATFYLADNAPNISESVAMLCLLPLGMLAGRALKISQARRMVQAQPWPPRFGSPAAALGPKTGLV